MHPKSRINCAVHFVINAPLAKLFSISNTMIRFIRCAKPRELIRMCHPVKLTGINDRTTDCCSVSIHIFCRRVRHNICPHSIGRQFTGVGNVLSTINGTPCACAAFANFSISNTVNAGLAIVSPKPHAYYPEMLHLTLLLYNPGIQM